MKAALLLTEQWEEANWRRLKRLTTEAHKGFRSLFKIALITANVFLYLIYQALKAFGLIIKLLLLTENSLNRIERDETWIFRQIK
jgi:hypothetical protein